jgi:hypothetical protein
MKKSLLSGFLVLFLLSATSFAGFAAPKNESEKPAATNARENRLSDEELSRLSKHAEIDNLSNSNLMNKEKNDSRNNLIASNQIIVEHHHHGYYWGGGVILLVILIVVLI